MKAKLRRVDGDVAGRRNAKDLPLERNVMVAGTMSKRTGLFEDLVL